jgi:hypothetical protein
MFKFLIMTLDIIEYEKIIIIYYNFSLIIYNKYLKFEIITLS